MSRGNGNTKPVIEQHKNRQLSARMLVVSSGVFVSRILGLLRDVTFAAVWGTSPVLAAFLTAWTIPNLLRSLFGEGAFAAAFVPAFSGKLETEGRDAANQLAGRTLSVLTVALSGVVLLIAALAVVLLPVAGEGLFARALAIVPWVMPYSLLICLSAGLTGILNSFHRFALSAFSQLLLNLAFIVAGGLAMVTTSGGEAPPTGFLVCAVLAAGTVQVALLYLGARHAGGGLRFQPVRRDPGVRKIFGLMAPAVLGAGVVQVNVLVDRILAMLLGEVAVTTLYYSQRLVYLPVGLFAVAAATVSLPVMSRAWARGKREEIVGTLRHAFRQALFFSIPVLACLTVLHHDVVKLFFLRASFTIDDALATAWTMRFYLPGIPAFVLAKVAVAPFHARQDTRTPVRIALVCLVVNLILNLVFMQFIAQGGLALATSLSSWLNVVLLFRALRRKLGHLGLRDEAKAYGKLAAAGAICMTVCALFAWVLQAHLKGGLAARFLLVTLPLAGGGLAYAVSTMLLKCPEAGEMLAPLLSRIGLKQGKQENKS